MAPAQVKLEWTEKAAEQLRIAYDYWADEKSTEAAETMLDKIFSAVEMLERHPEAARRGRIPATRELIIVGTPFLVVYQVSGNSVQILRVLHGARKWPERL